VREASPGADDQPADHPEGHAAAAGDRNDAGVLEIDPNSNQAKTRLQQLKGQ
jgi:hypothetical protein